MRRLTRNALRSVAVVLLLAATGCDRDVATMAAKDIRPLDFGGDFTLTDQEGDVFRLRDIRSRLALLFFGYTSCPDMCPMTMSRIMSARDLAGADATEVVTIFVSVDPERDTPAVLREYAGSFAGPVRAVTGTKDELDHVVGLYHATFDRALIGFPNYLVNHTTAIFLIDGEGRLRKYFSHDEDPDRLAAALRAVLNEQSHAGLQQPHGK